MAAGETPMSTRDDGLEPEVTEEQLAVLRELGTAEAELERLTEAEAEAWIDELRALREDGGPPGERRD